MYYSIQAANNKGADQTARMRRLICAFVVRIWHKSGFLISHTTSSTFESTLAGLVDINESKLSCLGMFYYCKLTTQQVSTRYTKYISSMLDTDDSFCQLNTTPFYHTQ